MNEQVLTELHAINGTCNTSFKLSLYLQYFADMAVLSG